MDLKAFLEAMQKLAAAALSSSELLAESASALNSAIVASVVGPAYGEGASLALKRPEAPPQN